MAKIIDLSAKYNRAGNVLKAKGFKLLISERKASPTKPRFFILHLSPDGQRTYISSLFPVDEGKGLWRFDYFATKYLLHLEESKATIREQPKNYKSDSIVSLSDFDTNCIITKEDSR